MNQNYILPPRYHLLPIERPRKNSVLVTNYKNQPITDYSYDQCLYTIWFVVILTRSNLNKAFPSELFDYITNGDEELIDIFNENDPLPTLEVAYLVLRSMFERKIIPTDLIFRTLIAACGREKNLTLFLLTIDIMSEYGYSPDQSTYNHIISAFSKSDNFLLESVYFFIDYLDE